MRYLSTRRTCPGGLKPSSASRGDGASARRTPASRRIHRPEDGAHHREQRSPRRRPARLAHPRHRRLQPLRREGHAQLRKIRKMFHLCLRSFRSERSHRSLRGRRFHLTDSLPGEIASESEKRETADSASHRNNRLKFAPYARRIASVGIYPRKHLFALLWLPEAIWRHSRIFRRRFSRRNWPISFFGHNGRPRGRFSARGNSIPR